MQRNLPHNKERMGCPVRIVHNFAEKIEVAGERDANVGHVQHPNVLAKHKIHQEALRRQVRVLIHKRHLARAVLEFVEGVLRGIHCRRPHARCVRNHRQCLQAGHVLD
jgi:hypothetical protein